jgi:RNA polymerase sigma-70 factor (ECF subfamily)
MDAELNLPMNDMHPELLHFVAPKESVGSDRGQEELLQLLRAGDDGAYEELVRRYGGQLLAVARRLLRREEDAQDAVQEAFLSAFKSLPRFRGTSSLSTWLHRIVFNAALMKLRSGSRHPESSIEEWLPVFDESGHHASPVPAWTVSAEAALLDAETRRRVRAAIESLPLSYRSVLTLRDIEDLDTRTVADLLSITPTAVKLRLHRARQALRAKLEPHFLPS